MTDQPNTEEVPLGMAMYAKWGFEKWQKQMYTEVAVAYRCMSLGIVNGDEDYTPEDMAEVDAEYRIWLAAHDRAVAAKALREAAEEAGSIEGGLEVMFWLNARADRAGAGDE